MITVVTLLILISTVTCIDTTDESYADRGPIGTRGNPYDGTSGSLSIESEIWIWEGVSVVIGGTTLNSASKGNTADPVQSADGVVNITTSTVNRIGYDYDVDPESGLHTYGHMLEGNIVEGDWNVNYRYPGNDDVAGSFIIHSLAIPDLLIESDPVHGGTIIYWNN